MSLADPPEAATLSKVAAGLGHCGEACGTSCADVAARALDRLAATSGPEVLDGTLRTEGQARELLEVLRIWQQQMMKSKAIEKGE